MPLTNQSPPIDYGPRRLTVELTNVCNLHCSYCLRDDNALYYDPASFLPVELLSRTMDGARRSMQVEHIAFTGGEPTLHPQFGAIIDAVASANLTCSFVTNGWTFERVWPHLAQHRETVTHAAFSVDGVTREAHDRWRGAGSFDRVVRGFSRCWASKFPFNVKVGIRRDTIGQLEAFALFAARMGASGLSFAHVMPTSPAIDDDSALSPADRETAEREIAQLARIFKMRISIDVGYVDVRLQPPCSALAGISGNVNYRGELSLCCNLSGFRGGASQVDIVADLNIESFDAAVTRLRALAERQAQQRIATLTALLNDGKPVDLATGSPCLFCLNTLGKTPWRLTPVDGESACTTT